MEAKAQSPANMVKALSPTIILLFAADNGPADPAAIRRRHHRAEHNRGRREGEGRPMVGGSSGRVRDRRRWWRGGGVGTANNLLSLGSFVVVQLYINQLFEPLRYLGYIFRQVTEAVTDLEKAVVIMKSDYYF